STSLFRKKVEAQFDPQIEFHQAYRLPGRNSSIQFQLERIEASYRVSPSYELLFHEAAAELSARFEIIVYRGSLDHVRLRWPGRVSEEWQQIEVVEPAERVQIVGSSGGSGEPLKPATGSNPSPMKDEIELHFAEPLNRTHGAVAVEIRARRPVQLGEEAFLISIPTADSESKPVSHLKVLNASNVESTIAAAGDTELRFVSDEDQIGAVETAELPLNLLPRYIESTSPRLTFRATVTTHDQVVTSSSGVVFKLSEDQIAVEQKLRYSVMYKELDRLRILVPGTIRPDAFRLLASDGTSSVPLTAEVGGLEIDGVRQIRVNLPAPKIGRFDILCSYSVPVDSVFVSSGVADIEVSLLQPAEIQSETTRVEIRSPGNVGVQLRGEQWTQELTLSSAPSWITPGTVRNVSLKLEAAPERATQNFVVRRSALRTRFQNGAATRTTGVYLIDGDISFLTVTLPANTDHSSLSVWWDGQPLTDESLVSSEVNGKTSDVRILLDDQPRREQHTLTLEFDVSWSGGFSGFNELHTSAPRFASDVWLADTIWEIVLPVDQHLFVYPNNYTPAFSWQRQALVWQRRPIDLGISLNDWLLVNAEPDLVTSLQTQLQTLQFDPLASLPYGNNYLFNAFGHQQEVRFQTMSEPAIILTGAGLTLAIGLVLLRIPATRHVLTVLVVGFGLSLAGLWHLEAVQLLLQPAVFGLILAVIASVIESRVKRRQRASLVTFSSPSDFLVQGSSREEIIHDASNELNERPA
ncbi:MAG: hypothetical protein HQ518_04255, partial [Rhodopirellula sp.]|nr:hypothetical protein [Rhodopirellula sp.]